MCAAVSTHNAASGQAAEQEASPAKQQAKECAKQFHKLVDQSRSIMVYVPYNPFDVSSCTILLAVYP